MAGPDLCSQQSVMMLLTLDRAPRVQAEPSDMSDESEPDALAAVLRGRPVLTLTFSDLDMRVERPQAYEPAGARRSAAVQQPVYVQA
jgi:hypothetical protein